METKKALLTLVLVCSTLYSQHSVLRKYMVVRTPAKYTLQVNINYNMPLLELFGTSNSDFNSETVLNGETFGASKGFGASVVSKICISECGKLRFTQLLSFNRMQSYLLQDKSDLMDRGNAAYNIYSAGLGFEYNFTPAYRMKAYAGFDFDLNMINGKIKTWEYLNNQSITKDYKVLNSFRMGFGVNAGAGYMVSEKVGLNFGIRLVNANLLLKSSDGSSGDSEFQLRDSNSKQELKFSGDKNFTFYTISLGVNFYFG
ncbi:MAG: hypothetical protein L0Y77_06725, partial [Chlorobi bacterium]|nr:hypothetical protein [Chlorobiota bacterium]